MKKLKIIHIDAENKLLTEKTIEHTLDGLQALVGGLLERVSTFHELELYVNEEGLIERFDYGFYLNSGHFVGNGFLVRTKGPKFVDVQPGDLELVKEAMGYLSVKDTDE